MGLRLDLHQILENITPKVYFQPPSNVQLEYPCIVYHRDYVDMIYANDVPYRNTKRYLVTVIARDPDSIIPDKVAELPLTSYNRFFTADDLNHDVFNVYF